MNRHYFCKRIINYYKKNNFKGDIFILDGSNEEIANKNYKFIRENKKDISVKYLNEKGTAFVVQKEIIKEIKTDYVTYSGDDDYFLISGLKDIVGFLESNKNFIGANGKSFNIVCDGQFSDKIKLVYPWVQTSRLEDTSLKRLKFQIRNYTVPVFSIFRKNSYIEMLNIVPSIKDVNKFCPDKPICDEILPAYSLSVFGKIKSLPCLHLIRTLHNPKYIKQALSDYNHLESKNEEFQKSFNFLKDKISNLQFERENTSVSKTKELISDEYNKREKLLIKKRKNEKLKRNIFFIYRFFILFLARIKNSSEKNFIKQYNFKENKNEIALIYKSIKNEV